MLDEATGVVDAESDTFISHVFRSLRGKVTVLLVTDRPSSAREASWIHVIDGGVVAESGSWERLSQAGGRLSGLVTAQGLYGGALHTPAAG